MSDFPIVDLSTDALLTTTRATILGRTLVSRDDHRTADYTGTTFRRARSIPLDDVLHFDR